MYTRDADEWCLYKQIHTIVTGNIAISFSSHTITNYNVCGDRSLGSITQGELEHGKGYVKLSESWKYDRIVIRFYKYMSTAVQ